MNKSGLQSYPVMPSGCSACISLMNWVRANLCSFVYERKTLAFAIASECFEQQNEQSAFHGRVNNMPV